MLWCEIVYTVIVSSLYYTHCCLVPYTVYGVEIDNAMVWTDKVVVLPECCGDETDCFVVLTDGDVVLTYNVVVLTGVLLTNSVMVLIDSVVVMRLIVLWC